MEIELKHTWRIQKNAWYIRLYLWVYEGNESDITFCKLWWAYVFMWIALPAVLIVHTLIFIARLIGKGAKGFARGMGFGASQVVGKPVAATAVRVATAADNFIVRRTEKKSAEKIELAMAEELPTKKQSVMMKLLDVVVYVASKLHMVLQSVVFNVKRAIKEALELFAICLASIIYYIGKAMLLPIRGTVFVVDKISPPIGRTLNKAAVGAAETTYVLSWPIRKSFKYGVVWPFWKTVDYLDSKESNLDKVIFIATVVIMVVAYGGAILFMFGAIIAHLIDNGGLGKLALLVGIVACFACFAYLFGYGMGYFVDRFFTPKATHYVINPVYKGVTTTTRTSSKGAVGFGKVMLIAFKSVKSNTCPKIEIEE